MIRNMESSSALAIYPEYWDYRKLAQKSWGLTDEQMKGMHVHHEPPLCKGGRNIAIHLYVCSPSMHYNGWHSDKTKMGNIEALEKGRLTQRKLGIGVYSDEWLNEKGFNSWIERYGEKEARRRWSEAGSKASTEQRRKNGHKMAAQLWQCTVTGFITNPGSLSRYQMKRGIDTSCRIRLQ